MKDELIGHRPRDDRRRTSWSQRAVSALAVAVALASVGVLYIRSQDQATTVSEQAALDRFRETIAGAATQDDNADLVGASSGRPDPVNSVRRESSTMSTSLGGDGSAPAGSAPTRRPPGVYSYSTSRSMSK